LSIRQTKHVPGYGVLVLRVPTCTGAADKKTYICVLGRTVQLAGLRVLAADIQNRMIRTRKNLQRVSNSDCIPSNDWMTICKYIG
jgi:hypothetical protein